MKNKLMMEPMIDTIEEIDLMLQYTLIFPNTR